MRRAGSAAVLLLLASGMVLGLAGIGTATVKAAPQSSCAQLASLAVPGGKVVSADEIAGDFAPPRSPPLKGLPPLCRVVVAVPPQINIEVWLPKENWNGRYLGIGGGGYGGAVFYNNLGNAVREGYAAAITDTGHVGGFSDGSFALNADRSLNKPAIEDFGYRSLQEMPKKAKLVIKAYYQKGPAYSYWLGCSLGGRQGLMAAQRFPQEYDGLVIGAPAANWDRFVPSMLWGQVVFNDELFVRPSAAKLAAVIKDAVAHCDALDGVADGVVNEPGRCTYDPAQSVCAKDKSGEDCLTPAEAAAIRKVWRGPTDEKGEHLWFGFRPTASMESLAKTSTDGLPVDWFRYWLAQDPNFDWRKSVNQKNFGDYFKESQSKFHDVLGTDNPDLAQFRKLGRKMLIWHGEEDAAIMPQGTLNYFDRVLAANGGRDKVDTFAKLYLAPGVAHCFAGPGPNAFGQQLGDGPFPGLTTKGLRADPDHDMFQAMVRWVEQGVPPGSDHRGQVRRRQCGQGRRAHAALVPVPEGREVERTRRYE